MRTELDAACERLNDAIELASDFFARRFQVGAEVPFPEKRWPDRVLGFSPGSRFYVASPTPGGEPGELTGSELASQPLHVRCEAAGRLEDLWRACQAGGNERLSQVVMAADAWLGFVDQKART